MKLTFFNILMLLIAFSSHLSAAPITHVVLDLDETVIQREQEFEIVEGQLKPSLQEINISAYYPDEKVYKKRTYYVRPGALDFLKFLVAKKNEGKINFSFLSFSHQARLNAVLDAIMVDGIPVSKLCNVAFGSEAVIAYSKLMDPMMAREGKIYKDLGLVVHPQSMSLWKSLKNEDFSILQNLKAGNRPIPNRIIMLDDKPEYIHPSQQEQSIKIVFKKKEKSFWEELLKKSHSPFHPVEESMAIEEMLSMLRTEKTQFNVIQTLINKANSNSSPNNYLNWYNYLFASRALFIEKALFKYFIPDILKHDSPKTIFLILGRDADLLYTGLNSLQKNGVIEGSLTNLPISRPVSREDPEKLLKVLETVGITKKDILLGLKKLVIVDYGYAGSVPKNIIKAFYKNNPNWKNASKDIKTVLLSTPTRGYRGTKFYDNFNQYLDHGGFIEEPMHQYRIGHDNLRRYVHFWEKNRPSRLIRPIRIKNGQIETSPSHPTERLYFDILNNEITSYFTDPQIVHQIVTRKNFLLNVNGNYPSFWEKEEKLATSRIGNIVDDSNLQALRTRTLKRDIEITESLLATTVQKESQFFPQKTIKHFRDSENVNHEWFGYSPKFYHAIEEFFRSIGKTSKVPLYPLEETDELITKRIDGVKALSRSARGEHTMESSSKRLYAYGNELSQITIAANQKITEYLVKNRKEDFSTAESWERFFFDLFSFYNEGPIFRDWDYIEYIPHQRVSSLENDWFWFLNWLAKETNKDYDPIELSAKAHYIWANKLHPFSDAVGRIGRDLIDFLFIRKNLSPPRWSAFTKNYFFQNIRDLDSLIKLIAEASAEKPLISCGKSAKNE
ncbi:MAG: hypothetical protein VX583_11620 [Bdellovibrionota bacterium]